MKVDPKILESVAAELLQKSSIKLQPDVKEAIKRAYEIEVSAPGKVELKNILDNIEAAEKMSKPLCQDTGVVSFYVCSRGIENFKEVQEALERATAKATEVTPLRPNAVHPITRKNSGNNVGVHIPNINWLYKDINGVEVTVALKGAGSENMSALAMVTPALGVKGVKKFVIDSVVKAGAQPCPPTILGVGIGGTVDLTFKLAKLALLRPIGSKNPDENIASLEKELLELINETGIGPMGLGGKVTCLDVRIEFAHCHTASLPVGINMQCWADRKATAKISSDGSVKYIP